MGAMKLLVHFDVGDTYVHEAELSTDCSTSSYGIPVLRIRPEDYRATGDIFSEWTPMLCAPEYTPEDRAFIEHWRQSGKPVEFLEAK
jgi:hypothetical protein